MQPISHLTTQKRLTQFSGHEIYIHLETTRGAYTEGTYGAFARNVRVHCERAEIAGDGPYRVGLKLDGGWVFAEGLTHGASHEDGRLLLAGQDEEGRLTVALQLSHGPFPQHGAEAAAASGEPAACEAAERRSGTAAPPAESDRERHLLVVLPHPDDESFTCAGYMAMLRAEGVPVTYVCATGGQMGRNMGRPPEANRETLPALRQRELREALEILGVRDLRQLGLWDKTVEFEDRDALAARIAAIIREVRPSTVITFHPRYGGHPDHKALGDAVVRAVRGLDDPARRPRIWCPVSRSAEEQQPELPVQKIDIRSVREQKTTAFRSHRSQTRVFEARLEEDEEMRRRFARIFEEERFWVFPPGS